MSKLFYSIFLVLFRFGVWLSSLFSKKSKLWILGRRNIFERLSESISPGHRVIWMHCASLGEFEQGRPVLEKLKELRPDHKILLTFFSPSGYEVRKHYAVADWVFYLPLDGKKDARRFLDIVHPELTIFVKYEFWYYYLHTLKTRGLPVLLISAIFRESQVFFRWYGTLHRTMLSCFTRIFVQDEASAMLLQKQFPSLPVEVAGDTRFDRVAALLKENAELPLIAAWKQHKPILVAGSTWPADEQLLQVMLLKLTGNDLIIAPHEIDQAHLDQLQKIFPQAILYSSLGKAEPTENTGSNRVLIIDNIGLLSRLYKYGQVAYVGGGFGKGIHNILEAAVYGLPVLFGPAFQKFKEANDLVQSGAAFSIKDDNGGASILLQLLSNQDFYKSAAEKAAAYVQKNTGAAAAVLQYIQEKRLLTN